MTVVASIKENEKEKEKGAVTSAISGESSLAPPQLVPLGTGALVYDGSELQDLFDTLENEAKKKASKQKLAPMVKTSLQTSQKLGQSPVNSK